MQRVMRRINDSTRSDLDGLSSDPATASHPSRQVDALEWERQKEELRRTQLALENSRTRFVELLAYTNALYNQAPTGHITLTAKGTIVEANLTAISLLATSRELLLQQPILRFIGDDDRETFHTFHMELLATPRPQRCEVRMVRSDGSSFFVQMDAIVTQSILGQEDLEDASKSGPFVRITFSDITSRVQLEEEERRVRVQLEETLQDLRQTQEQLVKQERMAVVGQLTAGIAHDFNNIMASITLYAQLVLRSPELPASLHKRMEAILTQSSRAAELVQQMLDFSRRTVMAREALSFSGFLQHFVDMLQHSLPDTIQVALDFSTLETGVGDVVNIDPGRIQQALLNLSLNARDAMHDGGQLRFSLSHFRAGEQGHMVASGPLSSGLWMRLEVSDSGTGIEAGDLPHLFEPFFTTKEIGVGSGLGLSQVWGLVKQHDGEIDVTSEVGKGATFTIYLPVSSATPSRTIPPPPAVVPRGRGELVLAVEDSDFLRAAITSVLTQLGYQAMAASNGQEAFDLIIKEGAQIALILTDLSMPVMGGKELIRAMRSQGWKQPVVVLSGQPLSASEIVQLESYGQVSRLQKPVVMERLALALHQALERDDG
jgi:PAS domain S-box-containing protein